ncbi:hypothetical protein THAOC_25782, partial [Thalassiosira oceanica]
RAGGVNARASQPEGRAPAAGGTDGPGERVELPTWRAQGEGVSLKDERPPRGVPVPEVRAGRPTAVGSETVETHSPQLVHGLADLRSLPWWGNGMPCLPRGRRTTDGSPVLPVVRGGGDRGHRGRERGKEA